MMGINGINLVCLQCEGPGASTDIFARQETFSDAMMNTRGAQVITSASVCVDLFQKRSSQCDAAW